MLRGLYSAATGMDVHQVKVESISNNLMNASTPGYKKEEVIVQSFPEQLLIQQGGRRNKGGAASSNLSQQIGTMGSGVLLSGVVIDHSQGEVQETGNDTDIMINGPGFFTVQSVQPGEPERIFYTRNGSFRVDQEGYLTDAVGNRILGEVGQINVGSAKFKVSSDGKMEVDGTVVDTLRLIEFDDPGSLTKEGEGLFTAPPGGGRQAASTTVSQGFLEMSNVNVTDEMINLVSAMRTYEANQRVIQTFDEILSKSANQVGTIK
ncbi:flagellar hook-basal body protein [Pelotomaculum propionicicum]|uniref:Flagellar basal-body rod protein FlgG n=1 Tax=Pelotomaculum propionicicum TaxID=258475 RepID=A0A4Y7RQ44_9FIRM|nr:flagellar hook-basal body protein [Pelotomaculum propionicicum]TEB11138.1 Flagellar basal-body rod protein FlgG [Pelotomaculum propionicicum]